MYVLECNTYLYGQDNEACLELPTLAWCVLNPEAVQVGVPASTLSNHSTDMGYSCSKTMQQLQEE